MKNLEHYKLFAEVFKYPTAPTADKIKECQLFLDRNYPNAGEEFKRFSSFIANSTADEIEEIYAKTFHIQAICFLDLGYVIFGEDYKRGEFLVNMKAEQRDHNNDCGEELSDNLANVLTLLPIHTNEDFVNELAVMIIVPALKKMLEEFDSAKLALKEKVMKKKQKVIIMQGIKDGNIYKNAISSLIMVFQKDFEHIKYEQEVEIVPPYAQAFVNSEECGTCSPNPANNNLKTKTLC